MTSWQRVVFSADCDEDGNCPLCGIDYAECGCPGPTMDGYEYRWINNVLHARSIEDDGSDAQQGTQRASGRG